MTNSPYDESMLLDPFGRDSIFGIRDNDWFDYPDFYEELEETEEDEEDSEKVFQELYNDLLIHGPIPELELAMELIINK